jgi:dTDP-glucose 4,6-dehydratase
MTAPPLARVDLDHVLEHTCPHWEEARGARVFLTGATGFFGAWLIESFLHANTELGLGATAVVLTRDPAAARMRMATLGDRGSIELHAGDVRGFEYPPGPFDFVMHAATESSRQLHAGDSRHMFDTIVSGTRRVLDFARATGVRRFLLVSSGAVYGRQPADVEAVSEDWSGAPDVWDPGSSYAEGKRAAEMLCAIEHHAGTMSVRAARCFAFVGPHLPLDAHFAIGNFISDALRGRTIRIRGDGTAVRSYLYMADLAVWLWTMTLSPSAVGAYNVGSERGLSILETARAVAAVVAPGAAIEVGAQPQPGVAAHRYVPRTERALRSLGLQQRIGLDEGIARTVGWLRQFDTHPS